uniref:RNA-binding protein 44 n=1 Tax=Pristiophorus japonicus TaxID=55135 RepID=UPI00398E39F8
MQSEPREDLQEPRMSSELNKSRMATFYCIWPCETCSYCNTLDTRKCRNCSEPMRDAEQPLYLEGLCIPLELEDHGFDVNLPTHPPLPPLDGRQAPQPAQFSHRLTAGPTSDSLWRDKNMLLVHNQRILATYSSAGKGHLCFRAVDHPNPVSGKRNDEGTYDKTIKQLFDSGMKSHTPDRGLRTQCGEEIIEAKCQLSNTLESAYETRSPYGSSGVTDLSADLTKGTGVLLALEQEKYSHKMALEQEYGNETNLSLDTEFEMYRKLNEMSLQKVVGDCFQKSKNETLHQYIPEYKDSGTLEALDPEPFPDYYSMDSTESHSFADFTDYLGGGEISHETQTPTAYPSAQSPAESDQFAHCSAPAEEIGETLFISAVTSTQRSFVCESNVISACKCAERPAGAHLAECKSIGISEGSVERVFNDCNTIDPNGSTLEQVDGAHNSDLQTEVLLDSTNLSEQCFPYQIKEFANDKSACSTSTDIESENQVALVPLNVMKTIIPANTVSKAEDSSQNQGDCKESNTAVSTCESPDHPGWGMSCELSGDSDQLKFFDDSFVSAAGDSIIVSVTAAERYCDMSGQVSDAFGPLEITEGNNKSISCAYQTSNLAASGGGTLIEGICIDTQLKRDCYFNKGSNALIIKVDQSVDACTDFRADFTIDKATAAMIPVVDRADNTDITLMSKNRPTLGQSRTYGNVACNTKWSIVGSNVKQQSTQTAMVSTEEKCINTILQTADFNSYTKELGTNQCKTKLRKVLGELELKKKCKSTELQQQSSLYLPVNEDGNHSSDCCSSMKQRAIKAELQLLKMQYWMCQQHCWRVYSMAIEESGFRNLGLLVLEGGTEHGAAVSSALQELKTNYQNTREKVLEGKSLDSLPLLSVELKELSCATFIPAALGEQPTTSQYQNNSSYRAEIAIEVRSREVPAGKYVRDEDKAELRSDKPQNDGYQLVADNIKAESDYENTIKEVSQKGFAIDSVYVAKNPEITDDWFDAEENFTASSGSNAMQGKVNNKDGTVTEEVQPRSDASVRIDKTVEKETAQACYIYIDGLPRTVTEMELRRLFQKYQVSGIWLCRFHSEYRCGVLRVASPNFAKLAVDEMNGREYHGKPIKVHLAKISGDHMLSVLKNHSQPPLKVHHLMQDHAAKDTNFKVDSQWESCSVPLSTRVLNAASHKMSRRKYKQMQCLQDTPTATGTFIPPNSASLSSFNKLMKTLLEMHPEANRDDIIQALKEVKTNNKGFLSGLALNTIVQLASAILKKHLSTSSKE